MGFLKVFTALGLNIISFPRVWGPWVGTINAQGLDKVMQARLERVAILDAMRISQSDLPRIRAFFRELRRVSISGDDDEEEVDRGDLIRRFRTLRTNVADNLARIETLCVCWDKLNADMSELTKALK